MYRKTLGTHQYGHGQLCLCSRSVVPHTAWGSCCSLSSKLAHSYHAKDFLSVKIKGDAGFDPRLGGILLLWSQFIIMVLSSWDLSCGGLTSDYEGCIFWVCYWRHRLPYQCILMISSSWTTHLQNTPVLKYIPVRLSLIRKDGISEEEGASHFEDERMSSRRNALGIPRG